MLVSGAYRSRALAIYSSSRSYNIVRTATPPRAKVGVSMGVVMVSLKSSKKVGTYIIMLQKVHFTESVYP